MISKATAVTLRAALVGAAALGVWLLCLIAHPPPRPFINVVTTGDLALAEKLLSANPGLANEPCLGRSPLHLAVLRGDASMVKLLLKHGADVMARDACGDTPLHAAAYGMGKMVLAPLLAHGADPRARNFRGQTPLHLTAYAFTNPYGHDMVHTLISAGARRDSRDHAGLTPLDMARLMRNQPVLLMLERP